jgi:hypothetical protein
MDEAGERERERKERRLPGNRSKAKWGTSSGPVGDEHNVFSLLPGAE